MTTTDTTEATLDVAAVQAFAAKVSGDAAIGGNAVLVHLGDRLGLWRALADAGSATSAELAERTGCSERYLREWLAAQASAGYVHYDAATRAFTFPAEHAMVLADDDSPAAMAGPFEFLAAVWASVDTYAHAFATGEGIAWQDHDPRLFSAVERFYRPLYANSLVAEWLPAVDGLVDRLLAGARVLDVGCGLGTPTIMMARQFPASTFVGVDSHEESIRRARAAAEAAGVADRVRFEVAEAGELPGGFDVVAYFDALHDMGDPLGALRAARAALAPGGVVLAVEPASHDHLEDNLEHGLLWFGPSTLVCLPNSLSQTGALGLGNQAGPATLHVLFADAGFGTVRTAARTDLNLVLEARR